MARTTGGKRTVLQLDPRVTFEALILNRLERIPECRRQEWLRNLLVEGFRYECRTLRLAQDDVDPWQNRPPQGERQGVSTRPHAEPARSEFATWLAKPTSQPDTASKKISLAAEENVPANQGKPFAGLRKVIG